MVFCADSTLGRPIRSVACRIWRCRFDESTTSSSMMPERAHPRRRQVQGHRRAQAARPEAEHLRPQQLDLPLLADLGQHRVARVTHRLLLRHDVGPLEGEPGPLPGREAARQRGDVLVAQLAEGPRRQGRPGAARAIQDDLRRLLGDLLLDAQLQEAAGNPAGAGDEPLHPLVLLAHVDEDGMRLAVAGALPFPLAVAGWIAFRTASTSVSRMRFLTSLRRPVKLDISARFLSRRFDASNRPERG